MTPEQKKAAEEEVRLLKVLSGPTLIQYIDSFTEKDNLYIVMEFAEGGCLHDKLQEKKLKGGHFTKDEILGRLFR